MVGDFVAEATSKSARVWQVLLHVTSATKNQSIAKGKGHHEA
jgi:hypothetical protein